MPINGSAGTERDKRVGRTRRPALDNVSPVKHSPRFFLSGSIVCSPLLSAGNIRTLNALCNGFTMSSVEHQTTLISLRSFHLARFREAPSCFSMRVFWFFLRDQVADLSLESVHDEEGNIQYVANIYMYLYN